MAADATTNLDELIAHYGGDQPIATGSRLVAVPLSDHDLAEIALKHAECGKEQAQLEEDRSEITRAINEKKALRRALDKQIDEGTKNVQTACAVFAYGSDVIVIRLDTGEEVERRAMTPEESQGRFEFALGDGRSSVADSIVATLADGGNVVGDLASEMLADAKTISDMADKACREAIGDETDADILRIVHALEQRREPSRARVVAALKERLGELLSEDG